MFFFVSSFQANGLRDPSALPSKLRIHGKAEAGDRDCDSWLPSSLGEGIGISAGEIKPGDRRLVEASVSFAIGGCGGHIIIESDGFARGDLPGVDFLATVGESVDVGGRASDIGLSQLTTLAG